MSDYGSRYTDKKISEVDKSLRSVYGRAQKELEGKLKEFTRKSEAKDKVMRRDMQKGLISEQDYKDWLAGQVFVRQQWERKISQVCMIMNDHNQQAINLINESRLDVFAENYNYMTFQTEKRIAISFDLYNVQAVARLLLDDPQLLPEWKIDEEKDYIWNYQKVKNIVTQAIIQGEGIPEITRHLCEDLSSQNNSRMRSLAITAMTGAENAGRQLQMESAAKLGIDVWKRWEATHDSRTRDLHRARDGEEVPYNEDFSGGMEYPGDPSGAPEDVYNCRCTMVSFYPEYENKEQAAQRYREMEIDGQSYEDWKQGKLKRGEVKQEEVKKELNETRYYTPVEEMGGMTEAQMEAINRRFMELDKKYHAVIDGGIHGLLERDQTEYDLQFDNYRNHLLEENPTMRRSTAEKRTLEILGTRPEYTPGHGSMRYLETGGEYREKDNLFTMFKNRDNWQDFRHTITLNPYSIGAGNTLADDVLERKAFAERNAERIAEGRTTRSRLNVCIGLEGTFIHEYGHAIDYTYGVSENHVFKSFYESLTSDDIRSISRYAETNEKEFIAEAFCESYMGETQGDVSKRFMAVLEEIINDKH